MRGLKGKRVIVTGGASGIGQATAARFLDEGCKVCVIDRDPEVMLAGDDAGSDAFAEWDRWPAIAANRYGNRFLLPADELSRPTTRVLTAGAAICEALQSARARRGGDEEAPHG